MRHILFIAAGGGAGAVLRYLLSAFVNGRLRSFFPWGTFSVNVIGSFLIGLLFPLLSEKIPSSALRAFFIIGFLGGFTTFSSYALESVNLLMEGEAGLAAGNMLLNNIFCAAAAFGGIMVSRMLFFTGE